jgi:hypothetical protein
MELKKSDVIHLRCYPREKRAVDVIAHYEGRTLSEMVREFIREGVASRGYDAVLFSDLVDVLPLTKVFQTDDPTG